MTDLEEKKEPIAGTTEGAEPKEDDKPMGAGCAAGLGITLGIICGIILAIITNLSGVYSMWLVMLGAVIAGAGVSVCVPKYSVAGAILGAISGAAEIVTFIIGIAMGDHYIDDVDENLLLIACPILGIVMGFNFFKEKNSNKDL